MTDAMQAARAREMPSQEKLRVYGDCLFLAMRSRHHAGMTLATLRAALEPAIDAGQFRIFRIDDIPRGMFTWAFLNPDAEARFVAGEPLRPQDWQSGDQRWLIDLIAPYKGMTTAMVRWIMKPGNFTDTTFVFRRVVEGNKTRKILHVDFARPDAKVTFLRPEDF